MLNALVNVGKLAIIGALLKAVKTSCVLTMEGRTYLIKHRAFSWSPHITK